MFHKFLLTLIIFLIAGCGKSEFQLESIPKFRTIDSNGIEVTEEIFSDRKISTLTIFTTNSEPSLNLLRKLDSRNLCLLANFKDKFDLNIQTQARILIANDDFSELLETIRFVPITFFIDSHGKFIGQPVAGDNFDLIQIELDRLSE